MITGELKSKIDRVWDSFWSDGIGNPLEVIEHITYPDYAPTGPDLFFPDDQVEVIVETLHHIKRTAVPQEVA